ncbi:MAG TPA: M23 family metallopeptidase [Actinomycetota bacterium]
MSTHVISLRRALALAVIAITVGIAADAPAQARSTLRSRRDQQQRLENQAARIRRDHRDNTHRWTAVIHRSTAILRQGPGRGGQANPDRWRLLERELQHARRIATIRVRRSERLVDRRLDDLTTRRTRIQAWIDTWGVFEVCPIRGWNDVSDNFGITVRLPGVPVHQHMGNDILAATGTPLVAPFDGFATASRSWLGGLQVRVHGALGYVYNAHLSRYGVLGDVHTGDVIGYVGSTGDATTPHDHLEWHPHDGVAVDPNPFLSASCG